MTALLDAALDLHAAGINVFPCKTDGSKAPLGYWKQYQSARVTEQQILEWFTDGQHGLGVFGGKISGNLEMLEIEGRAADRLAELATFIADNGAGDLWATINTGWVEKSPSGGLHWFYRIADAPVPGNDKIAVSQSNETLVETRGEGGFVVVAPTSGTAHETGQPWTRVWGGPGTTPTISADDRDTLRSLYAALLDDRASTLPEQPLAAAWGTSAPQRDGDVSPGNDFEQRTDWAEILESHGWTHVRTIGQARQWRRPGKTIGISATTGHAADRDRLYVFSSSTPFPINEPITKFHAHTLLNHNGDHSAAARALAANGYGRRAERHLAAVPRTEGSAALAPQPVTAAAAMAKADDDNSLLLAGQHGHEIRYVSRRGEWLVWNGHRWEWDYAGQVHELAKATIRGLPDEKHRVRSLSRRSLEAMVALTRSIPGIVVQPDDLDAHSQLLNTPDGIIDLTTGKLTPPNRDGLHTRSTSVTPARIPTPRWDRFLAQTFEGHTDIPGFVQRLAGYSATGAVTRHVLPFLHGSGGNGKSVFLDVIRAILGDYAATSPAKFLMAGVNQHETEIARLAGLRLVISSEVNENDRFDEAKVKLLTGGDALTARFMHQNHFTFTPTHTLWLMGNHQPRVQSGGDSFWRRLRLIPFTNTVTDTQRVDGLDRILVDEEGPGILQWVVDGAVAAARDGLSEPASVMAATRLYANEEDHMARFIEDRIHVTPHGRADSVDVRSAYETWCREQSEVALSPQTFGRELRTRLDVTPAKSNGRRIYKGIDLYADDNEPETTDWRDR